VVVREGKMTQAGSSWGKNVITKKKKIITIGYNMNSRGHLTVFIKLVTIETILDI